MINSVSDYGRVFLIVSVVTAGIGISACSTSNQRNSTADRVKPAAAAVVRTSAVKTVKPAHVSKRAAASKSVDPVVTASTNAAAARASSSAAGGMSDVIVGKTWNYEYAGSRGTITYYPDGTSNYNEPGLRKGTGKWQMRGSEFCQSFSGINEPCETLRQAGNAYHIGHIKLTRASP